jgi:uncharacterized protein YkwD
MSTILRRLAPVAFAALVAMSGAGVSPSPAAAADLTVPQAEAQMLKLLNAERAKAGLVALQLDTRLTAIARGRSADMANKHYFSHSQPDGRNVFDLINAAKITWYGAGEIIAWNNYPTLADSAEAARTGWMNSPGHRGIVMSKTYNYVGIGLAIEAGTGKKLWTGVFIKGPDRTGGWARFKPVVEPVTIAGAAAYRLVTVAWSGGDTPLVTLTAGFKHYQIQARTDAGPWKWWTTATTVASRTFKLWYPHEYDFRVRACDKVGNCGYWYTIHLEA